MRLTHSHRRRSLVDRAAEAYTTWCLECVAVQGTYRAWRQASTLDEPFAFGAYRAALDREEGAAMIYARLMGRAGLLGETRRARPLAPSHSGSTV